MSILEKIIASLTGFPTPDPTRVLGVDTSHWTGVVDWNKAKAAGIQFAIIKGMDGITPSRYFVENYNGAKAAGLVVGAYTWLYPTARISAGAQARAFVDLLKTYPVDIASVDFEWTKWAGVDANPTISDLYGFIIPFEAGYGMKPYIYTAPAYWQKYGSTAAMWAAYPLWQANYNVATPFPITPWGNAYKLWQWTPGGDGLKYGQVALSADLNYYNGTQAQFDAEYKHVTPPIDPPIDDDVVNVTSVTTGGVTIPYVIDVAGTVNAKGWTYTIDQRPPVDPPVVPPSGTNLYRIDAAKWPITHAPLLVPPNNGPLTQTLSHTPKQVYEETPLAAKWQNYIKQWNSAKGWELISSPSYGPSKGVNGNGLLRYIGLVWPSNASSPNVVKVLEISGAWARIDSIPIDGSQDLTKVSPTLTPWLFHRVCDNKGNPVSQNIICPILGGVWWCPLAALTKV